MIGSVKLSEINTRFMERYYQGLLQTKAIGNPVKENKKNEYVSASTVREIHKRLRNCFEQAINLSFFCSLRLGELLGLTWDCVNISPEAIEENRAYVYINKET